MWAFFRTANKVKEDLEILRDEVVVVATNSSEIQESEIMNVFWKVLEDSQAEIQQLKQEYQPLLATYDALQDKVALLTDCCDTLRLMLEKRRQQMREHREFSAFFQLSDHLQEEMSTFQQDLERYPVPQEDSIYTNRSALDALQVACLRLKTTYDDICAGPYTELLKQFKRLKEEVAQGFLGQESIHELQACRHKVEQQNQSISNRLNLFVDVADTYERLYRVFQVILVQLQFPITLS